MESVRGSRTAVFGASMTDDYAHMVCKDPDTAQRQTVIGTAPTSLPNRVSWYFDLRGPSIHVNTACSSSLIALDLACQSMRCGDADAVSLTSTIFASSRKRAAYIFRRTLHAVIETDFKLQKRPWSLGLVHSYHRRHLCISLA